jgi:hypothetical protein
MIKLLIGTALALSLGCVAAQAQNYNVGGYGGSQVATQSGSQSFGFGNVIAGGQAGAQGNAVGAGGAVAAGGVYQGPLGNGGIVAGVATGIGGGATQAVSGSISGVGPFGGVAGNQAAAAAAAGGSGTGSIGFGPAPQP